jgi:hypothetical protein
MQLTQERVEMRSLHDLDLGALRQIGHEKVREAVRERREHGIAACVGEWRDADRVRREGRGIEQSLVRDRLSCRCIGAQIDIARNAGSLAANDGD